MLKTRVMFKTDIQKNEQIIAALGQIGDTAVIPTLVKLAKSGGLFRQEELLHMKQVLFASLQGYPRDAVGQLLEIGQNSKDKSIRNACRQIHSQGKLMQQHEFQQDMVQLISNLNAAINNINMYSAEHPQAKRYLDTAYLNLSDLLRVKNKITLLAIDGNLIVDNNSLKANGPHLTQFISILRKSAIERLTFVSGLPKPNFMELIQFLSADESKPIRSNEFIKLGIIDLKVKDKLAGTSAGLSEEQAEQLEQLKELRNLKQDELKALYQDIKHHKKIDIRGVEDMIKGFVDGFASQINPLDLLASLKSARRVYLHPCRQCLHSDNESGRITRNCRPTSIQYRYFRGPARRRQVVHTG